MKKVIYITFSSKEQFSKNKIITSLINVIDKSNDFCVSNRWFEYVHTEQINYKIYEKNVKSLLNSDLIIAEVSTPSTGVGQQIAFGIFHKIPVLIIAKKEFEKSTQSRFLKGTKATEVSFFYYNDEKDLLDNIFPLIRAKLDDVYEKLNFMATKSIKKILIEKSRIQGISQSELLRRIITQWKESKGS